MHPHLPLVLVLAFAWGIAVAAFMEYTEVGDFLSKHLTWFMTALGCGVDLLLLLLVIDGTGRVMWWHFVAVFGVSSLGPSFRGIYAHKQYFMDWINGARDSITE